MTKADDIVGQQFGTLTVLLRVPPKMVLCRCSCGDEILLKATRV